MTQAIKESLKQTLAQTIATRFGIELFPAQIVLETPPRRELGEIAFPLAFELAKRLKAERGEKQNPRAIALDLISELQAHPDVEKAEVAGPGYLNVFLRRARYFRNCLQPVTTVPTGAGKLIVEHTSVNPNKAAHIGHLRNAVLGDTLVRLLRATGEEVEVQNYIDNTGVQVADVVVGFRFLEQQSVAKAEETGARFDFYCWDLYSRVGEWYEEDSSRLKLREETLHALEAGEGELAELGEQISSRVLTAHLRTLDRLGIRFELLARESDVLHLHFWDHAFEKLKNSNVIHFETEGKNRGCWVRPSKKEKAASDAEAEYDADKVIVRSNGTVTYVGKDIAYHLWKLGRLDLDFRYKPYFVYPDGQVVWTSTTEMTTSNPPAFGNGVAFFNVIDAGQSYTQQNVIDALEEITGDPRVSRSAHIAYEKVTLTVATCKQLGLELSEEDRVKSQVAMSGRKGLGVKVDDLLDLLISEALTEVQARNQDLSAAEQQEIAGQIAVGALRYFLLKFTRTSVLAFDFKEALAFEGETGPYIQYSAVRARNIFRKLTAAGIETEGCLSRLTDEVIEQHFAGEGSDLWDLVFAASQLDHALSLTAATFEPAHMAKYAFDLAQRFNLFYHRYRILAEENPQRRDLLIEIARLVERQLTRALGLLGMHVPEKM